MRAPAKLIIIGLDGLDPLLLRKMVDKGELPNFEKLIKNGVFGKLKSTIPPATFPAWPAMFTGKSPGNLGIFDFFELVKTGEHYSFKLVAATKWRGDYVWDILSHEGKSCGVINVPFFSPTKIRGYMISNFPETTASSYPKELVSEIKLHIRKEHDFDPYSSSSRERKRATINMDMESVVSKKLRFDKKSDVFIQVFRILDIVAHHTLLEEDLRRAYFEVDKIIKQYLGKINETNLIIVSDHGIKRMKRKFYINSWLVNHGYLKLKSTPKFGSFAVPFYKFTSLFPALEKIFDDTLLKLKLVTRKEFFPISSDITNIIDWRKTVALTNTCSSSNYVGMWLNRNEGKKIEELRRDLLGLKDPKTSKAIVRTIFNREDIYKGCELKKLPDVIVEFDADYLIVTQLKPILYINTYSFAHSLHGTLIACGPDFKKEIEIDGAEIVDVAPTILHIMGCPIPKNMDGKVLVQVFEEASELAGEIRYEKPILPPKVKERIRKELERARRTFKNKS